MAFPSPVTTYHQDTYPTISPTLPHLSTKGKNIVVTGGGSGIGFAIATSFAKSGASTLSILGRRENILLDAKAKLNAEYPNTQVLTFVADIVDKAALDRAFTSIKATAGEVDVLVANAGYLPTLASIAEADAEDWYNGFEVNVKGNFNLIRAFVPVANKNAAIIHLTTGMVHLPYATGYSAYHTSKLAGAKLFDYVHNEHPEFFVLNVHPGILATDMAAKDQNSGWPLDEINLPADFVNWAVSPDAKFLNGKLVWAHWDVEELIAMKKELEGTPKFTLGLLGWP